MRHDFASERVEWTRGSHFKTLAKNTVMFEQRKKPLPRCLILSISTSAQLRIVIGTSRGPRRATGENLDWMV
ncbi:hypothetical protein CEE69_00835 [Rhodopirellula bahusiensis]|uniref:Uncharacterized protein n=1 Tax=Rhodopirellula bahusiensis TaxID=2014065 RepID=A0A2G1WD36_9BACT|nr:hypothetical protein CEE69_00835 [Rhodopirellula bahusiensis]